MTRPRPRCAAPVLLLGVVLLPGCADRAETPPDAAAPALDAWSASSGPLNATLTAGPAALTTSGRLEVTLVATHPRGDRPIGLDDPPLPDGWLAGPVRTVSRVPADAGRETSTLRLALEPLLPGDFTIGPWPLGLESPGGEARPDLLQAPPFDAAVSSVLDGPDAEPAGAKSVVEPTWVIDWAGYARRYWWAGLLAAGAAALLGAALLAIIRRPERTTLTPVHELAVRAIDALEARDHLDRRDVKGFFTEASAILRDYIEDRFGLRAPERTTPEFLEHVRAERALTPDDAADVERFLAQSDMVKFARHDPGRADAEAVCGVLRAFVERTRSDDVVIVFTSDGRRLRRMVKEAGP